jgi:hypothetical protein
MTDVWFRSARRYAAIAATLAFALARASPACACEGACEERAVGLAMGITTAGMVAILAPLAARDLIRDDPQRQPSYGLTAAIAGGTSLLTVVVTAVAVPAYSMDGNQTMPMATIWIGAPLVLGMTAAIATQLLLRTPEKPSRVGFAVVPTPSGMAGMLRYSY